MTYQIIGILYIGPWDMQQDVMITITIDVILISFIGNGVLASVFA